MGWSEQRQRRNSPLSTYRWFGSWRTHASIGRAGPPGLDRTSPAFAAPSGISSATRRITGARRYHPNRTPAALRRSLGQAALLVDLLASYRGWRINARRPDQQPPVAVAEYLRGKAETARPYPGSSAVRRVPIGLAALNEAVEVLPPAHLIAHASSGAAIRAKVQNNRGGVPPRRVGFRMKLS